MPTRWANSMRHATSLLTSACLTLTIGAAAAGQTSCITVWGGNDYGQCDVPDPNTDFVAVAAGYYHSLGLKSNGSLVVWGANTDGQCDLPNPNTDFVALAVGNYHNLCLKSDGSIVAWGWNSYGQCDVPAPNSGFVAVAAGNAHGQCDVPAPNADFVTVAAGYTHSLGVQIPLPPIGACCINGYYLTGTEANCLGAGGSYQGDGTDCDSADCSCLGDINGDGARDQSDLGILLASYEVDDDGDLDGDGFTDQADLGLFLAVYEMPCP